MGEVPEKARLLVAFDSPTLAEVVRRMNKTSDNFVAEVVFKTLGAGQRTTPGPATWDDAAAGMRAFVASLGLPSPVRVDNGSGLFDASAASASQVVALLGTALRDFHIGPEFLASLPIGGVDGTLQSRFRGRPAAGLVRGRKEGKGPGGEDGRKAKGEAAAEATVVERGSQLAGVGGEGVDHAVEKALRLGPGRGVPDRAEAGVGTEEDEATADGGQ